MSVDKKTQIDKTKKNKRTISAEPDSELSDSLHEIQTSTSQFVISTSQFVIPGKKSVLFYVVTSTAHFIPTFKSN